MKVTVDIKGLSRFTIHREPLSRQGSDLIDCPPAWGWFVESTLLVCPLCCQPWARLTAEGHPYHRLTGVSCEACRIIDPLYVGGSILSNLWLPNCTDIDLLRLLPPALLEREARIHLEHLLCLLSEGDTISAAGAVSGGSSTASSTSESPAATSASAPSPSPTP